MYESKPPFNSDFQDILMSEPFFNNFAAQNNLNYPNTTQPPSSTLSEFDALQAMLGTNNGNSGQNQQNSPNNAMQDFNIQYSDNSLFSSPSPHTNLLVLRSSHYYLNPFNSSDD